MPTSAQENKNIAKYWIDKIQPKRVLDVGCGEGTYSNLAKKDGQEWVGIEAFYPYVQRYDLSSKYNKVIVSDIRYTDYSKLGTFDLSIAADMLEHMTKQEAQDVIKGLLGISEHLLICFPILHLHQHIDENPFEDHIDHWSEEAMTEFLLSIEADIEQTIVGDILAYYLVSGKA